MPKAHSSNWLTMPARPNSRIRPRPTTKGGVMMGNNASTPSGLVSLLLPRSAYSAMSVPNVVVPAAVSRARNSVFQATPQRTPPTRQESPQTRSLPSLSPRALMEGAPVSSKKAPTRLLPTGSATNSSNKAEHSSTAPATKTSLRK